MAWDRKLLLRGADACVFLTEAIDAAFSVHDLLLAGEERMASRADVDTDFFLSRACMERVATNASDDRVSVIIGMKSVFHEILHCT